MADILIHGISMPRERDHLTITINADGTVQPLVDMYCPIIAHAIELPEHGDLIDRDKLLEEDVDLFIEYDDFEDESGCSTDVIRNAPVIVPSNKEDDE